MQTCRSIPRLKDGIPPHGQAEQCPERPPFPADPRADQRARPGASGDRQPDDRPSRARVRRAGAKDPGRDQADLRDQGRRGDLPGLRHRSLGGGIGQHAVARRPCLDVRNRTFRLALARAGRAARPRCRLRSRRLAPGRRSEADRGSARRGQEPRDQGGYGRPQRDLDRRRQPHRRNPARHRRGEASGAVHGRYHLVARLDRLPPRRMGRRRHGGRIAEGPDAAARPVVQRHQRQGAGDTEICEAVRSYWDWGTMLAANKTGYFPIRPPPTCSMASTRRSRC